MTIQMKDTEQYFPVLLFVLLHKVVLPFESVDEMTIQIKAELSCRYVLDFSNFLKWNFLRNFALQLSLQVCDQPFRST